jgi:hypothetical protein
MKFDIEAYTERYARELILKCKENVKMNYTGERDCTSQQPGIERRKVSRDGVKWIRAINYSLVLFYSNLSLVLNGLVQSN